MASTTDTSSLSPHPHRPPPPYFPSSLLQFYYDWLWVWQAIVFGFLFLLLHSSSFSLSCSSIKLRWSNKTSFFTFKCSRHPGAIAATANFQNLQQVSPSRANVSNNTFCNILIFCLIELYYWLRFGAQSTYSIHLSGICFYGNILLASNQISIKI